MGFMIPMADWLAGSLAADVLLDPRALERGLFREERVRALVAEHESGVGEHAVPHLDAADARALVPDLRRQRDGGAPVALSVS